MDAVKSVNTSENLSIRKAGSLLSVERRKSISPQDTIFLNIGNVKAQRYRFDIASLLPGAGALSGYLADSYMHTLIPVNLNGNTSYNFTVENVAGSYAAGRFYIIFNIPSVLGIRFKSISAHRVEKNIKVDWTIADETGIESYDVERSGDGIHFSRLSNTPADNLRAGKYDWLDTNPVTKYNYYRIKAIDISGAGIYSDVVKVYMEPGTSELNVYPNPVTAGNAMNLYFGNGPAGLYEIKLYNNAGQLIISNQLTHLQGRAKEAIEVSRGLAAGIYQLSITGPDGSTEVLSITVLK